MGTRKYPVNACGLRDDLSVDMFALSRRNFVPLVLAPQPKISSYAPERGLSGGFKQVTYANKRLPR